MRGASALALIAVALLAGACGGGDDGDGPSEADRAEAVVRDQLRAIEDENAADFCATLTPEYARTFTRQIAGATSSELKDCPAAFSKARSLSDSPTFEGRDIAGQDIDEIDFHTNVDGSTAAVEGPRRVARYELVQQGGEWKVNRAKAN